jgi:hypothetical protein
MEYRSDAPGVWKTCVTCGGDFNIRSLRGRNRLYCSAECRPRNAPTLEARRRYQHTAKQKKIRRREAGLMPAEQHGTLTGYTSWCCKCDRCRAAFASYRRELRAEKKSGRKK